jgi:Domain of unknown function (DUF4124)
MIRALVFVAVLAGMQAVAQADVYRWIDAQGRVQYSDRWMPGSELVKVDKTRQNPEANAARQSADQKKLSASNNRIAQQQAESANVQAVQQDVAKVQQEQCAQAKDRYDKAIHARRIFKEGKDGSRDYISDADADAYRVKARADMQAVCGTGAK